MRTEWNGRNVRIESVTVIESKADGRSASGSGFGTTAFGWDIN
jgi:hypothetical protein